MSTRHHRDKDHFWGMPVPGHLKHGQGSRSAKVYGCECEACWPSGIRYVKGVLTPHAERQKALRERKQGQPVPAEVKHGIYAYRVYGCRCDICVATNRRARKRQRSTWRNTTTGHWGSSKDATGAPLDVLHWPPVGHGDWTCPSCGQLFPHRAPKEQTLAA